MAGLVYLALAAGPDEPRDLLRHLNVRDDILQNSGLGEICKMLKAEHDKPGYCKNDGAFKQYERQWRRPYQMEDYTKDLRRTRRQLEREDTRTTISDNSFARTMLRRSGLTNRTTPSARRGRGGVAFCQDRGGLEVDVP